MANLTKGQLAAENAALRAEINTLREQLEQTRSLAARPASAPRPAYEMPAWQVERKEKMERAREAAMQLRTMIKV